MPVFALGRLGWEGDPRLTEADLAGVDRGLLLAGLPGARLTERTLEESFTDALSTIQPA